MKKKIKKQNMNEKKVKRLSLNVVKTNIRAGQNSGARRSYIVF